MVLAATLARPSASICLRCQLREVLTCSRPTNTAKTVLGPQAPTQRCNGFASHSRGLREDDTSYSFARKGPLKWKHIYPDGRVVGKGVKRQRVTSENLTRNSLDKPSSVVILRDVPDNAAATATSQPGQATFSSKKHIPPSAKEIEHSIMGKYQAPKTDEVNASIAAFQPASTIVDEKQFDALAKKLSKSYTSPQLSRYLYATIKASAGRSASRATVSRNIQNQSAVQWMPGRTPLDRRHQFEIQSSSSSKKLKTIEQILRLCWHITIESEEQEVGELDLHLQPWELSMLFDLYENDKPYYQSMIRTQMLIDTTELQPYRPDSVVRITGRRTDAEDAAWQLKSALLSVQPLRMDLTKLVSEDAKVEDSFSDEELGYVSDLTKSVLSLEPEGIVAIYNRTNDGRNNARRLLLSMLRVSVSSFSEVFNLETDSEAVQHRDVSSVPTEPSESGLHRRWAGHHLTRELSASEKSSNATDKTSKALRPLSASYIDNAVQKLGQKLTSIEPSFDDKTSYPFHEKSYWNLALHSMDPSWGVNFCRLLRDSGPLPNDEHSSSEVSSPAAVSRGDVPGMDTLLSYFEADRQPRPLQLQKNSVPITSVGEDVREHSIDWSLPQLMASLVPLPSKGPASSAKLPRVELRYHFTQSRAGRPRDVMLTGMKADIDRQKLNVPLPDQTVDLSFGRSTSLIGRPRIAINDEHIRHFTQQIQKSILTGDGVLSAPPEITILLPHWLVHPEDQDSSASKEDIPVTYLFERFRQTQRINFSPNEAAKNLDDGVRELVEKLPTDLRLDYREVDGGAIYGNTTRLNLVPKPKRTTPEDSIQEEDGSTQELVASALRIAHLLSRANAGTLPAFHETEESRQARVEGDSTPLRYEII